MNALLVASRSVHGQKGRWSPIGRLEFENGMYRFVYTKGVRMARGFVPFKGMEDLSEIYQSDDLFPVFANRMLPESRPEYDAFLRWSGFDSTSQPDPLAILGVTEGIRRTDMIELFPCPIPDSNACYFNKFFLHGLRHMPQATKERVLALSEGEGLSPMLDICNSVDPKAVSLRTVDGDQVMLGYVPRYLAHDVRKLFELCQPDLVQMFVDRVNSDAPLQHRLLCRMQARWPKGFRPCSDEAFQPIPQSLPELCSI